MLPTIMTRTRRLPMLLGALGILAAVWVPAPAGAAQSPPLPSEGSVTYEAGVTCAFEVRLDFRGKAGTLALPNGTVIFTSPALTVTVTNVATGKQVELNVPGPVQLLESGELVFIGPSLVSRSTTFGDDTNTLAYVAGRYTFLAGREPPFSGVGMYTDICAVLA
jgi:hypothetical protein